MISLIYFYLAAAALVSLQCGLDAAHIDKSKLDNNLQPNVIPNPAPKRRIIRKFVHISEPLPETIRHVPGTTVEIECPVIGKPAPSVEWLKNGEPMNDYEEVTNDIMPSHPSSLARLTSKLILTVPSNGDEYTCVATAGLKRTTSTTTVYSESDEDEELLDIQKLLFKPAKPIITYYFNEVFQDIGSDIVLPCHVQSLTKSQVLWQDPNDDVIYGDSGRIQVLPSGDLLITNLRWSDMGNFTCTAKNMYGKESVFTFMYPTKPQQ